MRFYKLDLNLLVVFDVLLSEKSVVRAAERLNLTQPAISNSLAKLREHFEDDLFVRSGRRMMPTYLALSMQEPIRHVLLELQSIAELRPDFDPRTASRTFTIAASDYASVTFLSTVARRLRKVAPEITIKVLPLTNANITLFGRGDIDLVLLPASMVVEDQPYMELFKETYTCIASRDNSSVGSRIDLPGYLDRAHVVAAIDTNERLIAHDEDYLQKKGHKRKVAVVTHGFSQLPYFIVGTPYLATVHLRLAKQAAKTLPLKIVKPNFKLPEVALMLQWHAARSGDAANSWIRTFIQDCAAKH